VSAGQTLEQATPVTLGTAYTTATGDLATESPNDDSTPSPNGHRRMYQSGWYTYTPATHTLLDVDTRTSDVDVVLNVWSQAPGGAPRVWRSEDDGGAERYVTQAYAGVTYYFQLGTYGPSEVGTLGFILTALESDAAPLPMAVTDGFPATIRNLVFSPDGSKLVGQRKVGTGSEDFELWVGAYDPELRAVSTIGALGLGVGYVSGATWVDDQTIVANVKSARYGSTGATELLPVTVGEADITAGTPLNLTYFAKSRVFANGNTVRVLCENLYATQFARDASATISGGVLSGLVETQLSGYASNGWEHLHTGSAWFSHHASGALRRYDGGADVTLGSNVTVRSGDGFTPTQTLVVSNQLWLPAETENEGFPTLIAVDLSSFAVVEHHLDIPADAPVASAYETLFWDYDAISPTELVLIWGGLDYGHFVVRVSLDGGTPVVGESEFLARDSDYPIFPGDLTARLVGTELRWVLRSHENRGPYGPEKKYMYLQPAGAAPVAPVVLTGELARVRRRFVG
jgi:hypothetical protein